MKRPKSLIFLFVFLVVFCYLNTGCAQEDPEIKNLLAINTKAVGGKEKISQIDNYSFITGNQTVYLSAKGKMKLTSGKDPVITEVILASSQTARRNCFNEISEYEGFEKTTLQSLAKIRGALYTLNNYKGQLELQGLKKFGPKNFHMLTAQEGDMAVEFYIDSEDYLLKRIVFSGFEEETGKYEVNYDFVAFQEVDGVTIPQSWFASQVGTRGSLQEATDVQFNRDLPADFFDSQEVNVGEVETGEGVLRGNIVDFAIQRGNRLQIATNWTNTCIQRAGFAAGDRLILEIGENLLELDFYDNQPPRSAYSEEAIFLMPNRGSENFVIYFFSPEYNELAEKLALLMPIGAKKK